MSENFKFWLTIFVSIVGSISVPFLVEFFKKPQINGKIISFYNNVERDSTPIFLLKLAVVCSEKDLLLSEVDVRVKFKSSQVYNTTSLNYRKVVFFKEGKYWRSKISGNECLNNLTILRKDTHEVGYLYFKVDSIIKDEPFEFIEFIFRSYDSNLDQTLRFEEHQIQSKKLFYDDSIWEEVSSVPN
jgi:hypothetical protein